MRPGEGVLIANTQQWMLDLRAAAGDRRGRIALAIRLLQEEFDDVSEPPELVLATTAGADLGPKAEIAVGEFFKPGLEALWSDGWRATAPWLLPANAIVRRRPEGDQQPCKGFMVFRKVTSSWNLLATLRQQFMGISCPS